MTSLQLGPGRHKMSSESRSEFRCLILSRYHRLIVLGYCVLRVYHYFLTVVCGRRKRIMVDMVDPREYYNESRARMDTVDSDRLLALYISSLIEYIHYIDDGPLIRESRESSIECHSSSLDSGGTTITLHYRTLNVEARNQIPLCATAGDVRCRLRRTNSCKRRDPGRRAQPRHGLFKRWPSA